MEGPSGISARPVEAVGTSEHGSYVKQGVYAGYPPANFGATATLTLTDCILIGNFAGFHGGGIANGGTATLTNCTLSGNSARAGGGGIANGGIDNSATLTLRSTIVANSPAGGDCVMYVDSTITDNGHNLIEDATNLCGLTNGVNGNIVGVDPLLSPLAANGGPTQTHALCTGAGVPDASCTGKSPAIDAVPTAACVDAQGDSLTTDQRGYGRPQGPACDIGAYESGAQPATVCAGDCSGNQAVDIDEIIILVNIALGSAAPATCPSGIPPGASVDVGLIIQAVNNAQRGCTEV